MFQQVLHNNYHWLQHQQPSHPHSWSIQASWTPSCVHVWNYSPAAALILSGPSGDGVHQRMRSVPTVCSPRSLSFSLAECSSQTPAGSWSSRWPAPASSSCDLWSPRPGRAGGEWRVPRAGCLCFHPWACWFHAAGAASSSPGTEPRSGPAAWRWRSCWRSGRFRTGSGCAAGTTLTCSALCPGEAEGNNAGRWKHNPEQ